MHKVITITVVAGRVAEDEHGTVATANAIMEGEVASNSMEAEDAGVMAEGVLIRMYPTQNMSHQTNGQE
jgi:hypothetical protein